MSEKELDGIGIAIIIGMLLAFTGGCVSARMEFPGYPGQACTYRGNADNMTVSCVPVK